ncbi:MAG: sigma-54 dependent transcriptional regulator [Methylococcales bacterium]|nr:sigma-54 dependent transcriptional regulator [Methylococcales bacterium]
MTILNVFALQSWLETHDSPFLVIADNLTIVAVNSAWETAYGFSGARMVGKPCCAKNQHCRHRRFFEAHKAYAGFFSEGMPVGYDQHEYWITGYSLKDVAGQLFLGESLVDAKYAKSAVVGSLPLGKVVVPAKFMALNEANPYMIGISPAFVKLHAKLQQIAKTNVPILLRGETGTGKEVAAKFIHAQSNQAKADIIVVDCTLLTESLCESELFGHEKGAFTNAMTAKQGLFELAHNGTLFLDEIGELPLSQQPKLLRALESGQFRRVGGTKMLTSNVRVVCATHRQLGEMVKDGLFREDLFYRLSVLSVEIPPLRERKQDLPVLANYLLQQEGHAHFLTQSAVAKLLQHSWPGNIRELKNCLQLAVAMAGNKQIDKEDIHILRRRARSLDREHVEAMPQAHFTQSLTVAGLSEKEVISHLITKFQGNRKLMAAEMNISERTLYRKLSRFALT